MLQDDNKTKEQELAKSYIRKANYIATILMATGTGKTKIGVDIIAECIQHNPEEKWIIVVPTENLRDIEWKREFVKWGYEHLLSNVTIECIATAYKRSGETFNAIMDEIHSEVGPEQRAFLLNNKFDKLIGLTATIDDSDKYQFINSVAPIVYTCDINRARALEIIAPYYIFNLALKMSEETAKKYKEISDSYSYYEGQMGGSARAFKTSSYIIKTIKEISKEERTPEQKALLGKARMYWVVMQKRKTFLYNCPEKIQATIDILNMFKERKALVFSETISFAKSVNERIKTESVLFHSKMTKNERYDALRYFESPLTKTRVISTVKALNAGFNVPECSLGICASGNSKWLDFIQRSGRISRKQEDKIAVFINLYMEETQDAKWVTSRTKTINVKYLKWITNLNQITW